MSSHAAEQVNQLRTTLSTLEAVLNTLTDAILWTDLEGTIQGSNLSLERLLDRPGSAILGLKLADILPDFDSGCVIHKDGRCFEGHSHWQQGQAEQVWIFRDITDRVRSEDDRQRAEQAIQASEERLEMALEAGRMGIWDWNIVTNEVTWSDNLEEIHGMVPGSFGGTFTDFLAIVHPEDQDWVSQAISNAVETGTDYDIEFRILWADGSLHWIAGKGQTFLDANRQPIRMVGLGTDITDRKQAEAALRRSELKYRNLFENSQAGIYRIRLGDGLIVEANQHAIEAIGYDSIDEVVGKKSTIDFYVDLERRDWVLGELAKHGKLMNYELRFRRRDGAIRWGLFTTCINPEENWMEAVFTDITDRKQTEEALRRSELKYRNLFENSQVGIGRTRLEDGLFLDANQRLADIVHLSSPSDLIGKQRTRDFQVDPDDRHKMLKELEQNGEVRDFETELLRADGSRGWGLFSLRRNVEEGCLEFVLIDISERKRVENERKRLEEELRQSKQFLDSIIDNIPLTLFAKDVNNDFRYVLINKNSEQILGFSREGAIGLNDHDLISKDLADGYRAQDLAVVQSGNLLEVPELQITTEDQSFLARVIKVPLFDAQNHLSYLMCIAEDVTARAQAEEERKRAEAAVQRRAQIDSLLSSISRQLIDQDLNTAIAFSLEAIAQLIGAERTCIFEYSHDQSQLYLIHEWCAATIAPLISRGGSADWCPYLDQQLRRGRALQLTSLTELPAAAPERQMFERESIRSIVSVPMIHADKLVGFIGADTVHFSKTWSQEEITLLKLVGELIAIGRARHRAEEDLRIAKEAAEAANRAKSVFLANMSHELRTPLNAILGFSQLMERDPALGDRQRDFLGIINRSGEHLLELINDVLEMSKIEAGRMTLNPAPFDLHRLLQTLQEMFQVRAEAKQLWLKFEIAPSLPQFVITDEGKLRQVLINLLGNATKFTQVGGVTLRAAIAEAAQTTGAPSLTLEFEVEDTGRGIASEEIGSLFQPFVQTASGTQVQEGTGLGLTISRQFVQLMKGNIRFTSQLNQGSIFYFDIQVQLANAAQVTAAYTQQRVLRLAPGQATYQILIVDDRAENRELIEQLLKTVGFVTQTASNGQEAVQQWQTWQPDLIWMDMRMPIMDGYEATRQIRSLSANSGDRASLAPKIIALTASAFDEQRAMILAAGCDDMVAKPFREQVIFEKMAKHLGVQYLYEEKDEEKSQNDTNRSSFVLSSSSLLDMSAEWVAALHQAALAVDADQILQLIQQIPESQLALAESLTDLMQRFCFDEILELTQGIENR